MLELLTTAEMAEADRLAIAGRASGMALMENAGRAVADATARLQLARIVVVAGPGNNGGDGFVAARHLAESGHRVRLCFVGERQRLKGDAAQAADRWSGPVDDASPGALTDCDAIVDALFGAGLDRDVDGLPRAMIGAMTPRAFPSSQSICRAGSTEQAARSWGCRRRFTHGDILPAQDGHLLLPGRLQCGAVEVADIGIPEAVLDQIKPQTFVNAPAFWGASFPRPDSARA